MRRQEICYSYELDKTTRWAGDISDDDSCVVLKFESDKHPREVVLNQVNWEIDELKKRKNGICINDGTEANGPSLHECFIRTSSRFSESAFPGKDSIPGRFRAVHSINQSIENILISGNEKIRFMLLKPFSIKWQYASFTPRLTIQTNKNLHLIINHRASLESMERSSHRRERFITNRFGLCATQIEFN